MAGTQIRGGLAAMAAISTAAAVHAGPGPTPLYVDAAAPAGGNGSSWSQAFRDLQDALALAKIDPNPAKQYDIRVAQGVYTPDRGTGNRAMTFLVASGMTLTGGYAGMNAANPDLRDPSQFVSVLSGDLNRDDAPGFGNTTDNTYSVVRIEPIRYPLTGQPEIVIDGLMITGANDSTGVYGGGGGISISSSNKTVRIANCHILNNRSRYGGGVYSSSPVRIEGCVIAGNRATTSAGGGVAASEVEIHASRIVANAASGAGGGVQANTLTATSTEFSDNASSLRGGGISCASASLDRCVIAGNSATSQGGGLWAYSNLSSMSWSLVAHNTSAIGAGIYFESGALFAANCTIVANAASSAGGALNLSGQALLENVILAGNTSPIGPAARVMSGTLTLQRSLVPGGTSGVTPAASLSYEENNLDVDPMFVDPVGSSASPNDWRDKNYRLRLSSRGIDAALTYLAMPPVGADLDGRPWPIDITDAPNTGIGPVATLDIGAYERTCTADANLSGGVTIDDLFFYFNDWFTGAPGADINDQHGVTIDDLFFFLNAWFRGC